MVARFVVLCWANIVGNLFMVAGFVVLCWANTVGNIISAEKRCNYPGRSRVTQLVEYIYRVYTLTEYTKYILVTVEILSKPPRTYDEDHQDM